MEIWTQFIVMMILMLGQPTTILPSSLPTKTQNSLLKLLPLKEDDTAEESQRESSITELNYLPEEAKNLIGQKYYDTKGEEYDRGQRTKFHQSHDNSVGHEKNNKETLSQSHKENKYNEDGKRYKGAQYNSGRSEVKEEEVRGHKGHNIGKKGHRNRGDKGKGFQNVMQKVENGRKRKFFDEADNLKYHSDHDHFLTYKKVKDTKKYSGGAKEISHHRKALGKKDYNEEGNDHSDFHKNDKSYGHEKEYGEISNYQGNTGHKNGLGSSYGRIKDISPDSDNKVSYSQRRPTKIVVRRRKVGQVRGVMETPIAEVPSTNIVLKVDSPSSIQEIRPRSPHTKNVRETKVLKQISNSSPISEVTPNRILSKRKINIKNKKIPMSIFVRLQDLKHKENQVNDITSDHRNNGGHSIKRPASDANYILDNVNYKKIAKNSDSRPQEKDISTSVQNAVVVEAKSPHNVNYKKIAKNSDHRPQEKDISTSVHNPVVVEAKSPKTFTSKEESAELLSADNLQYTPRLNYEHSKSHKKSHHQTSGEEVRKGGQNSSGASGNHHSNYGKHQDSKFFDKDLNKKSGHNHVEDFGGHLDAGTKASKGHAHGKKGYQRKGHSDEGFKNLHRKLEFSSKKNFYHDEEDKNYHNFFDDFDKNFDKIMKENIKANNFYGGQDNRDYSNSGYDFDKLFEDHIKHYNADYSHDDHEDYHHHHGLKKQQSNGYHQENYWNW